MKPVVIMLLLLIMLTSLSAHTYVDSIYADNNLTGNIAYSQAGAPLVVITSIGTIMIGDTSETVIMPSNASMRGYLSFELPVKPDGYNVIEARLQVYQSHSVGNGEYMGCFELYPNWNIIDGENVDCFISHINYGAQLEFNDWVKGDEGNEDTYNHFIGVITHQNLNHANPMFGEQGHRYMDVTSCVYGDYSINNLYSQYRIAFEIDTDGDSLSDYVGFSGTSGSLTALKPILYLTYSDGNSVDDEMEQELLPITIFPQPIHDTATIQYQIAKPQTVEISIYNVRGRKVEEICRNVSTIGTQQQTIGFQNHPSGVYFVRVNTDNRSTVKRILHLR